MPILSNFPGGSGTGSGGLTLASVSGIKTLMSSGKMYVKWTDPEDLVVAESVLAAWGGTLLVRKAGSEPVSRRDGTVVLDSKVRNEYQNKYFCDSGLSNGVTYYYKFFPYTTQNSFTDSPDGLFNITPEAKPLGNVTGISAEGTGNGKLSLKWTDPEGAVVSDGITLITWAHTTVVVKEGGYATSPEDPGAVYTLKSTTRNQYASSPLVVTGLTNGSTYYVSFFPTTTDGAVNANEANRASAVVNRIIIPSVPAQSGSLTYTGSAQTPSWTGYDSEKITLEVTPQINAGNYNAVFTPKDDYMWADSTTEAKTVAWGIAKAVIASVPTQSGSLVYNGAAQSPSWTGYDPGKMTMGGATSGTNAGSYSVTFTPLANYVWSGGSGETKTVTWSIARATIAGIPAQSGSLTYNGNAQTPSWSNYDSATTDLSMTAQTNAGSYNAVFTPKANYQWNDGKTDAKTISWSIGRATIANVPAQSGSLTYNGQSQSPSWSNYDGNKMTLGGTTSSVNAGSFTATFTPKPNYQWSGGDTAAKNVGWSIAKAAGSLSLSTSSVTLDSSHTSVNVTVTRAGNGTISARSNNTGVASVSVSGNTVTIRGVNNTNGSTTVTVSVAAGTNHTAPSSKNISVTASFLPARQTLDNTPWSDIKKISDANAGASYWSVGDRKAVRLQGTCSKLALNGTYYFYILGFNHNSSREGSSRIHFQLGFSYDKHIALISGYDDDSDFYMNPTSSNIGGWDGCFMRRNPCRSFVSCLPSDLQSVLKTVTKYTDNKGGGNDTASNVSATTDTVFLLSEYEVFGARTYANSAEKNYQEQYQYYKNGNAKIRYKHNDLNTAAFWWLRSPHASGSTIFCAVAAGGNAAASTAHYSRGFAPAFCV